MKSHDHRPTSDNAENKLHQGNKVGSQVTHPLLQLQQLVGNRTVTKMIQRQAPTPQEEGSGPPPTQATDGEFNNLKVNNLSVTTATGGMYNIGGLSVAGVGVIGSHLFVKGKIVEEGKNP